MLLLLEGNLLRGRAPCNLLSIEHGVYQFGQTGFVLVSVTLALCVSSGLSCLTQQRSLIRARDQYNHKHTGNFRLR
jgi:hypothetical protein